MLESTSADLRTFKHDYINILSTLSGYIENEDITELKTYYYNEIMPESNKIINRNLSLSLLAHIKLNPLKALLADKIAIAYSEGININLEIPDDINFININIIDLCRIIGIFMDNSIESSVSCDNKFIHFAAIKTDDNIIFNISNSCLDSIPPVHKLYERNFSTKGKNRGLGLNNAKDIITNNYKNILLNTTIKNCIFTQEIIIYNR
ncbi:MAG: sensor histidine kinase [Clostridium sp.]